MTKSKQEVSQIGHVDRIMLFFGITGNCMLRVKDAYIT